MDFMTQARARAKADGTKLTDAMSAIAREDPEAHRAFVAASRAPTLQKIERLGDGAGQLERAKALAAELGCSVTDALSALARADVEQHGAGA